MKSISLALKYQFRQKIFHPFLIFLTYMCETLKPKINTKEKFKGAQKKRKEEENLCSGQAYTHFDILLDWMIFHPSQKSRYIEIAYKENAIFTWLKSVWNTTKNFIVAIVWCCFYRSELVWLFSEMLFVQR